MSQKKVTASALTSTDVRGKQLFYIKLENEQGETYFINVGQKTYEQCAQMQNQQQPTSTNELQKKGT